MTTENNPWTTTTGQGEYWTPSENVSAPPPQQYSYTPVPEFDYSDSKSKIAAGLFAIFFGALGIHNFYLGRSTRGLIQAGITIISLGFFSPLVAIWGFIEGILIFTAAPGSKWAKDANGKPLRG